MQTVRRLLIGVTTIAALAFFSIQPHGAFAKEPSTAEQLKTLGQVIDLVLKNYVDKPEDEKVITSAINGILKDLDPHSSYMSPKEFRDMQSSTRGQFGGVGMEVGMEDGFVKVVAPIDDTPAFRAGILAGDLITHIDGQPVQGLTINQAVEKLRGEIHTPVKLTIKRSGVETPIEKTLIRDVIRTKTVRFRVKGDVGYMRLSQFSDPSYDELVNAISSMTQDIGADRVKGFVLDLRNNPGGLLDQAIYISDLFMTGGTIVSTKGRGEGESRSWRAERYVRGDITRGKPLIVLVNGGSASASEIVASALQDNNRATIIGSRSFGKASVQTIIPLENGGALRLTTARYYRPNGHTLQGKGVNPDIEVLQDEPDDLKGKTSTKGEASLPNALKSEDGKTEAGSQAYIPPKEEDDKALNTAIGLLHGTVQNPAFHPASPN